MQAEYHVFENFDNLRRGLKANLSGLANAHGLRIRCVWQKIGARITSRAGRRGRASTLALWDTNLGTDGAGRLSTT
jgi:hypothetical protein